MRTEVIADTGDVPPQITKHLADANTVKAVLDSRAMYTYHALKSLFGLVDAPFQAPAPLKAALQVMCEHNTALSIALALDSSLVLNSGGGALEKWVDTWAALVTAVADSPGPYTSTWATNLRESISKSCALDESVVKAEEPTSVLPAGGGKQAADATEAWVSLPELHTFQDLGEETCLSQSQDAKVLGVTCDVLFMRRFLAGLNFFVANLLPQDSGYEDLEMDLLAKSPIIFAKKVARTMQLTFNGTVSTVASPGCLPFMKAFGVMHYISGNQNRSLTAECPLPAWMVPVESKGEPTCEVLQKDKVFTWPLEQWGVPPGCVDKHCEVQQGTETETTAGEMTVQIEGQVAALNLTITWPCTLYMLAPAPNAVGKSDVKLTRNSFEGDAAAGSKAAAKGKSNLASMLGAVGLLAKRSREASGASEPAASGCLQDASSVGQDPDVARAGKHLLK